ncbi:MAG: tagaturonate reductase [Puia sp.]|nr:tagaturonate reductase [Puia sp.]
MELSIENLEKIRTPGVIKPGKDLFALPEKVLQFGTGVLLRGLPDYFIDKANRQGIFNGRVVVVKSTESGDSGAFDRQGGLYTLCVRGISQGRSVEENIISAAISRVLSAKSQWNEILQCARDPAMQIVISNTTEVGIRFVEERILPAAVSAAGFVEGPAGGAKHLTTAPSSYPGKLLAFLYERYRIFKGSPEAGMVIIPTELIVDNGKKLASVLLELARFNGLEQGFTDWLAGHNHFCSSLVDRIVPGKPGGEEGAALQNRLGYADELLSISEVYRLWAIEGGEKVRSVLSFAQADPGVIIEPDIEIYRELKLRLLNGTHTLSCGLAYLAGFGTVKQAMNDPLFASYVSDLMLKEIAPSIPYELPLQAALDFGAEVLDRFRNPHLQHQWISITMQYSSKIKMRDIPVLLRHYETQDRPPLLFSLGFAAYLLFMRGVRKEGNVYEGQREGSYYPINDERAGHFFALWEQSSPAELVSQVLHDEEWWGTDLSRLKGFEESVLEQLKALIRQGPVSTLAAARERNSLMKAG